MIYKLILEQFKEIFKDNNSHINLFFAPGRVNIIGEHIDYNGGLVLPAAINYGIYLAFQKRQDNIISLYSKGFNAKTINKRVGEYDFDNVNSWVNYPIGVLQELKNIGLNINCGFNAYVVSNIPGSGLSSSAALELAFLIALRNEYNFNLSRVDMAKIAQRVENNFLHLNCGIMDQFASALGKKNKAILLNCNSLKYQYIDINIDPYSFLITNSNVPHHLNQSHYNERFQECKEALKILKTKTDIDNLADLSKNDFEKYAYLLNDTLQKRVSHIVNEQYRVKECVNSLKEKNIDMFASCINESGQSLKNNYCCTCPEIDLLVETSRRNKYTIASRMIGGGWGGNVLSVVLKGHEKELSNDLEKVMLDNFHIKISNKTFKLSDGARKIF